MCQNRQIMSELHEAASTGNLGLLEDQLSKGLNPSERDPEWGGRTPLHIASSLGHKKCVYVLIQAGAAVNAVTDIGWTPAHCACETGQVQCLQTLLSSGCKLVADNSGDTPLRIAEIYGHSDCIQLIKEHLQSVNGSKELDKKR